MNIRQIFKLGTLALALCSIQAMAQTGPSVTIGTGSGQVGSATPVVIGMTYDQGTTVVGFQYNLTYDTTSMTADLTNCGGSLGGQTTACSEAVAGSILVLAFDANLAVIPSGSLGSISFDISSAAINTYPLAVTLEKYGDDTGTNIPSTGSTDGSVQVSAGPQPEFTGTALGLTMAAIQGETPNPAGTLTVTNTGQAASLLTGTCSIATGGATQISVSTGGFTDVAVGASGHVVGVACDASVAGSYTASLECTHNGSNATGTFPVACNIAAPGSAVYNSTPATGATIEMTPAGDVPVGATVPDQTLTISNGATATSAHDLALTCTMTGGGDITVKTAPTSPVAPNGSTTAVFACSAAHVAAHSGTYSCGYDVDGDGTNDGTADYIVTCGVRAAHSDIKEAPASGTALSIVVAIGGSGTASVNFSEILNEGEGATVDSCSVGTAEFSVLTTMPATVTAGSTVKVEVEGTDPGNGTFVFNDTLTCTYTDSDSTAETVTWPITMTVSQAVPIPTLSVWGLMLMILTLMGLGGMVMRRKVRS